MRVNKSSCFAFLAIMVVAFCGCRSGGWHPFRRAAAPPTTYVVPGPPQEVVSSPVMVSPSCGPGCSSCGPAAAPSLCAPQVCAPGLGR